MSWLLIAYLAACYVRAVYVVLFDMGFDERHVDGIFWHLKDNPVGSTIYLIICLAFAVLVAVKEVFVLPFWAFGTGLGLLLIRSDNPITVYRWQKKQRWEK